MSDLINVSIHIFVPLAVNALKVNLNRSPHEIRRGAEIIREIIAHNNLSQRNQCAKTKISIRKFEEGEREKCVL